MAIRKRKPRTEREKEQRKIKEQEYRANNGPRKSKPRTEIEKARKKITDREYRLKNLEAMREHDRKRGASIDRGLIQPARKRAKQRGLEFNIEISDIKIPEYCPVLGIKLERGQKNSCRSSPSLDRIDSTKGYIKGNVWIISHLANTMKSNATTEELTCFAKWVLNNLGAPGRG